MANYWAKRFSQLEEATNRYGQEAYRQIDSTFNKAQIEMQKEIDVWYARLAKNNEISIVEARKLLSKNELKEFHWDVEEYIKYGRENALNQKWMKELENASAKFHIDRLEALKIRTQHIAEKAFGNEVDLVDGLVRKSYTENYYKSIFEVQKGFGVGFNIGEVDENKLSKLIAKPWAADGKDFSSRIWEKKSQMVDELHKELTRTCILGGSPDKAIQKMSRFVDSKFINAKAQAGRLVMTESAFFASTAKRESFNELGVEEFEVVATLDSHTSSICQTMDGKHFPMDQFEEGITAPPFHVWCRSTTCPHFNDEFTADDLRASRNEDGKVEYVPADMKYPEWKEKFVLKEDEDSSKIKEEKEIKSIEKSEEKTNAITYKEADENVEKELQKKSDRAWNKELLGSEKNALKDYTGSYHGTINRHLQGRISSDEWVRNYTEDLIKNIDEAMKHNNIGDDLVLFRGVSAEDFENWKIAETFKTFLSTSLKREIAEDFGDGFIIEIYAPRETRGLYLGSNSTIKHEKEMLLDRNQKYEIIESTDNVLKVEVRT